MEKVYVMGVINFLNDLSYLKAKDEHEKKLIDAVKPK
jgi:hypothetical protein